MEETGSQILFRAMKEENVDTLFGYPGGSVMDIYDEMFRQEIRHILVRHEQAAIHAADGYARASGRVGVCLVTSGPGATNTVTGIANAYMDSIPVVVLTGQVPTAMIGNDGFQEVDITGITRTCTKHNFLVRHIGELHGTVREAFRIARSGRPGPVLVDLPKDVIQAVADPEACPAVPVFSGEEDSADLEGPCREALNLLSAAKRPLLIIGGGVILGKATGLLRDFAKKQQIPVVSTLMGLGAFPGTDPLWAGMPGMHGSYCANMAISRCDLLIAIGVRFDDRVTSKVEAFAPHAKLIHIDIDPVSIDKVLQASVSMVSDCGPALGTLLRLAEEGLTRPASEIRDWHEQLRRWKEERPLRYCRSPKIKPQYVIEELYRLTGGRAIVATEVGQNQMWAAQFYRFDEPNTFLTSGGLGAMGFGFPAAIGAQVACPDRTVVDVAGDGSIQMNIQELATVVHYDLPVKVVILNNLYLGMVRQWQELYYGRRYSQSDIAQSPDFVKLAEAYGAKGLRAVKPEEVQRVLSEALETPGPVVMDFQVEPEENVYPIVRPGAPLTEMVFGPAGTNA